MITSQTGISHGDDAHAVAIEAATAARKDGDTDPLFVIVLASVKYDQKDTLRGVLSVFGADTKIIGASTAGEITEAGPAGTNSIAVMALYGENVTAQFSVGEPVSAGAFEAGAMMAKGLQNNDGSVDAKLVIMFPDVLTGNGADIVRGAQSVLGTNFPIVGGAAGDDFRFETTYQYMNGEVKTSAVVAVGLSGDFSFGVGVRHGWMPVGLPMTVTKAEGAILYELDGKPAIDAYRDYFGDEVANEIQSEVLAKTAVTYPLGMRTDESQELLIRDPLSVDENGAITCAGDMPEGAEVRLMLGSKEEAIQHAALAAEHAYGDLDGKSAGAVLVFNCIARNKLFAEDNGEEIIAIKEKLGGAVPLIGFYTYGEQAPFNGETKSIEKCNPAFHNETVVIVALA